MTNDTKTNRPAIRYYFTVVIPPVAPWQATSWHGETTLCRGAFRTSAQARAWAADRIPGYPYNLRRVRDYRPAAEVR